MKMQMTSFYANKLIHNLEDELRHWKEKENELSTFVVTDSENAIGPDYDFQEVSSKMESINKKSLRSSMPSIKPIQMSVLTWVELR